MVPLVACAEDIDAPSEENEFRHGRVRGQGRGRGGRSRGSKRGHPKDCDGLETSEASTTDANPQQGGEVTSTGTSSGGDSSLGSKSDDATSTDFATTSESIANTEATTSSESTASRQATTSSETETSSEATTSSSGPNPSSNGGWATGGTSAITDVSAYPNPFTQAASTCVLMGATTAGPCTTEGELVRSDISEGWDGLPVRLMLRVVDENCQPLPNARVKIWHTNYEGTYSGETPNNRMCLSNQDYATQNFFRGVQVANSAGVVGFNTCFPGWYRGRAVHIHLQVTHNDVVTRVSQVFFPESTTELVFNEHEVYQSFGQPDTTLGTDNVARRDLSSSDINDHIVQVQRMDDGVMLASKTLTVAS